MIGHGRSSGAISIVNALLGGVGAAAGIELWVDAELELRPVASPPRPTVSPSDADTPVVRASLEAALGRFLPRRTAEARLRLTSRVPMGCGLKSSSAVSTAVVEAVAAAAGHRPAALEVARLAAEAARNCGQSATGAFDDCLASLGPGIWVTDNRTDDLLRHEPVPPGHGLVVWRPPGTHRPSPELAARFEGADGGTASALALSGRPWEAMEESSRRVEQVLGEEITVRGRLYAAGAVAVGLSGLGPAVAVVVPAGLEAGVAALLEGYPGEVHVVPFRRAPPGPGEP